MQAYKRLFHQSTVGCCALTTPQVGLIYFTFYCISYYWCCKGTASIQTILCYVGVESISTLCMSNPFRPFWVSIKFMNSRVYMIPKVHMIPRVHMIPKGRYGICPYANSPLNAFCKIDFFPSLQSSSFGVSIEVIQTWKGCVAYKPVGCCFNAPFIIFA